MKVSWSKHLKFLTNEDRAALFTNIFHYYTGENLVEMTPIAEMFFATATELFDFNIGKYGDIEVEPTKKEFAEHIKDHHPIAKAIMFAMWDGKDYDKIIWKALKPEFKKL